MHLDYPSTVTLTIIPAEGDILIKGHVLSTLSHFDPLAESQAEALNRHMAENLAWTTTPTCAHSQEAYMTT